MAPQRTDSCEQPPVTHRLERQFSALTSRLVSALTVLALVMLLFTAASHQHASASEDLGCAVCTAVFNQATDLVTPVALPARPTEVVYRLATGAVHQAFYSAQTLLPRNCGPPERT
jgi:hypothetical protein